MSDDISLSEAERSAGIVRCDACPVLCRIRPDRAGACDRYANEEGKLVRVDPLVLLAGGDALDRAIDKILARPEVKERLAAIGFGVTVRPPEDFGTQIKAETARWAKVIRDANIKRIE